MKTVRNLLALAGVFLMIPVIYLAFVLAPYVSQFQALDEGAARVYLTMARTVLSSGDAAEATVYKRRVEPGLGIDEVEETLRFVANELNVRNVGELPMYLEVQALTGEAFPFLKIYMFCDAGIASRMVTYSSAMAAYLPCRIVLQEDADGNLWLMTLNLDLMIHGGKPLPEDLLKDALFVRDSLNEIIDRAATGAF
ncbi:protein of unknown function DUF302 [Thioalkalivibrio sulfidiphilus HL-EbGr7]|uniref:DUF302 domain-containing protein n=1 Tax=Thioalkalivibrio sulfidiphilus (strain HL-EbGR7) TaxID=396588 RepID=B8GSC6_THISH|nr:DUF302 domain-containing protein [Thioalkalivibrio sulfidiphilus]ACL72830.1 protein of unknown function DUF302 [Thioalkalivibrio sulfidiphilus HL-EbGr7]